VTDASRFREQFPVFERVAYLNAGTEGPLPRPAAEAVQERLTLELEQGRAGQAYFEATMELAASLRGAYARVLGCEPEHVALTGSTTDGINTVLAGLEFQPGDEILTTDQEHPGLLAPLGRLRQRGGVEVRMVPFGELVAHVGERTRLIACSHVSWVGGEMADLASLRTADVPVLLDAAQSLGAVPVDVTELGCDFYAASGQKWLCGPEGSGCMFVRPDRLDELGIPWPGYGSLADPERALALEPAESTKRLDHGFPVGVRSAWALASLRVLEEAGWDWIHERGRRLAAELAAALAEQGLEVLPRGASTLVSWVVADPVAEVERLRERGFVVRSIPGRGLVRAAVGAWSQSGELHSLAEAAGETSA
jgi:L-cysteine/cystine lyase